jgi:hypothetical protein
MRRPLARWLGLALGLSVGFALGCDDLATCAEHRDTRACECSDRNNGVQVCLPEHIWAECDCTVPAPLPDGGNSEADAGSGAGAGSSAGETSGAGGSARPPPDESDDDAGAQPAPGGAGSGGNSGSTPPSAAYRECKNMNDCDLGASCELAPAGLQAPLRVCAPNCVDVSDCPIPESMYEADLACVDGRCRLDCTAEGFPLPIPQTCPIGMICVADDVPSLASYCYDDGA